MTTWFPLVSRDVVVGMLGGAGLVLKLIYNRRGPLIYPVYAAILVALGLVSSRFRDLPYLTHFIGSFVALLVATGMSLVVVLIRGGRQRREMRESGQPMVPGHAPAWGFPLILLVLATASAAVAYVSS